MTVAGSAITRALAAGRRAIKAVVVPTFVDAERASRKMSLPTAHTVDAAISAQMQAAGGAFDNLNDQQREMVLIAVAQDRERVTGLEAKGFASLALPLGVITLAVLVLPHPVWPSFIAAVSMLYAGCAVISAALVVKPSMRAAFLVERAADSDALPRLVAACQVNRPIATSIQNRVWAALMDTLRAAVLVLTAAIVMVLQDGGNTSKGPVPTVSPTQPMPAPSVASTPPQPMSPAASATTPTAAVTTEPLAPAPASTVSPTG